MVSIGSAPYCTSDHCGGRLNTSEFGMMSSQEDGLVLSGAPLLLQGVLVDPRVREKPTISQTIKNPMFLRASALGSLVGADAVSD